MLRTQESRSLSLLFQHLTVFLSGIIRNLPDLLNSEIVSCSYKYLCKSTGCPDSQTSSASKLIYLGNIASHLVSPAPVRGGLLYTTLMSPFCSLALFLPVKVKDTQLCLTFCDPMDYTVYRILQARILEWVAIPFSRGSCKPRDRTQVSRIAGRFFTS